MKPVSALTIAVAALVTAGCGPALPNDAELMATFEDNRRAFEHVRQLVLPADGVERIERNKLGQLTQLSDAQRKGLADFMDATGVRLITAGSSPKGLQAVEFTIHRSGFVFGGAMKGIGGETRSSSTYPS